MNPIRWARGGNIGGYAPITAAWIFLVAAGMIMPAITSAERITVPVLGEELNARVAFYLGVTAIASVVALPIVLTVTPRPVWLKLMLVTLGWVVVSAVLSRTSVVDWLPTTVRFALYFAAATIGYWFGRSLCDRAQVLTVSRLLPLALLAAAAVPAAAGIAELVRGTAPILNGAPRVSGSMPTHPVAYSLVLALSAIVTIGPAILRGRSLAGAVRWIAIAGLMFLIFTTYTRLTILLLVACGVAVAALLPAARGIRVTRVAGAALIGIAVVFLALPTFDARFTYATPLSAVIFGPDPTPAASSSGAPTSAPASGSSAGPTASPGGEGIDIDIDIDASASYRILLTQRGLAYLSESPIIGHGPGSFDALFEADTGRANVAAHNDLMSLAVETGLPGLVLYLLILGCLAWVLWPRGSTGLAEADTLGVTALIALGAVNVGGAIHNPLYFVEIQLPIWIMVGTVIGMREGVEKLRPPDTESE
jgi:hypothetical protein